MNFHVWPTITIYKMFTAQFYIALGVGYLLAHVSGPLTAIFLVNYFDIKTNKCSEGGISTIRCKINSGTLLYYFIIGFVHALGAEFWKNAQVDRLRDGVFPLFSFTENSSFSLYLGSLSIVHILDKLLDSQVDHVLWSYLSTVLFLYQ
ncbi:uncharacterized protein MELLADRAFT_110818 [Melampsora larici-populina 98AG31]|uniref:Uncharacterized protein n=1 Tax=Melampsora larici-populina (strain 98AG31 / pathotype 3-4-7) TaxID=747676 RepID=F4S128_MELLP|nr:uncharacterized protein MELLADRAFT_110818 [Melampsora larici-populina 98AG31]EGG01713.1 hypothetical protein MELLADRAFT_110818 [Melampsora larici-populina 98AG31]